MTQNDSVKLELFSLYGDISEEIKTKCENKKLR